VNFFGYTAPAGQLRAERFTDLAGGWLISRCLPIENNKNPLW
jgi:hypothetical protein